MQASNAKTGPSRWLMISYALLAALLALIGYRVASVWAGHALVILFAFFATWFVEPKARRMTRFAHLTLSLTLLLATALFLFLNAPQQIVTIDGNRLLNFFIGGTAAKVLVSIIAALLVSIVVLITPILIVIYVSSEWILAMREEFGVTRRQAVRLLLSMIFHTSFPYYVIENGEMTLTKPSGLLPALGGPGVAVVKPYNAVVFERSGNITRIEGPGMFMTKRFEFVKEVINLRKQWIDFTAENVLTKDHVPLTFHCGVGFRIETRKDTAKRVEERSEAFEGSRFVGIIGGDYPVYKRTIYRAVYGTTAAGWRFLSKGATETQLRAVLRKYCLEDLYRLRDDKLEQDGSVVDAIAKEVISIVGGMSPAWGTSVYSLTIKSFEAPQDVKEKLLEMWGKRYEVKTSLLGAGGERDAALTRLEAEEQIKVRLAGAERDAALTKLEADKVITVRLAEAERDAALVKLTADEQIMIRIAGAERDAALAKLLADRQRIISLSDAERLAITAKARGESQALLEAANAERGADRIKAEGQRDTAGIRAEAFLEGARAKNQVEVEHIRNKAVAEKDATKITAEAQREQARIEAEAELEATRIKADAIIEKARAEAEAAIIEGRGTAEARVELYRRILALEPYMDPNTLAEILKKVYSVDDLRTVARLYQEADERRLLGRRERMLPPTVVDANMEADNKQ